MPDLAADLDALEAKYSLLTTSLHYPVIEDIRRLIALCRTQAAEIARLQAALSQQTAYADVSVAVDDERLATVRRLVEENHRLRVELNRLTPP